MAPALVLVSALFPLTAGLHHKLVRVVPSLAVCETSRPCGSETARSTYIADLLSHVNDLAAKVVQSGRTPAILHIGANNFGNLAQWTDRHLYSHVLTEVKKVAGSPRLLLVEPMSYQASAIMKNAAELPIERKHVELVHTMVNGTCLSAEQGMYRFSSKIESDFNASIDISDAWIRADRDYLIPTLKAFIHANPRASAGFKKLLSSPEVESYIEKVAVPCVSPSKLLEQMQVSTQDLVMVNIDAEGCDSFIVDKMVDLPGFHPAFLMFEGEATNAAVNWVFPKLVRHGFMLGTKVGDEDKGSDADNVIAVPRASLTSN